MGKRYCDRLFSIEDGLKAAGPETKYEERQKQAVPVLDELLSWLKAQQSKVAPKSALDRAIYYTLEQWEYLERYLLDGRLEVSNNRAERSIKPFVIDCNNFLFCNTPKGADGSAVIFSLIETAKENGLSPYEYLRYVFTQAPNMETFSENIDVLLPWNMPETFK